MAIRKSEGVTTTERTLAGLCERTVLKLWSYPNPCREDGKELCDLLVVFEDNVLIFFDRESLRFENHPDDFGLAWQRWRKEVIDKQVATAAGAARYIRKGRPVYLDERKETPFPIPIDPQAARIHKIVVAHGARDACRAFSPDNVSGSLAIAYGDRATPNVDQPFFVELEATAQHYRELNRELRFFETESMVETKLSISEFPKPTGTPAASKAARAPASGWAKVGRNELCPCGSGKKYKKCHLRN